MKVLEKISLEKIRNDRKNPIVDFDVKDAVITHYLHNNKNGVSQFYKNDAIEYTNEILKNYVSEDYTNYVTETNFQLELFNNEDVPFLPIENPKFKFIDLFAGIGGFRLALQNLGGKCKKEFKESLKSEAIRVISSMPDLDPRKERVRFIQPIKFKLTDE